MQHFSQIVQRVCTLVLFIGLSVCLSVCVFPILAPRAIRHTNSSISEIKAIRALNLKRDFSLKTLLSEVMASFAYCDSPLQHSSALELAFSTTEYSKVV